MKSFLLRALRKACADWMIGFETHSLRFAGTAVGIAKIVFFVFIVLTVIAFVMGRKNPADVGEARLQRAAA